MSEKTPLVLVPGLLCDGQLWRHQTENLADIADIIVADMTQDDSVAVMADRVLDAAPQRFALAGLSMGGYVAQEVMRRASQRVTRLALLDTSHLPDALDQIDRRDAYIEQIQLGPFKGVTGRLLPLLVHPGRLEDTALTNTVRAMAESVGKAAFLRQQKATMGRPDGTRDLGRITCPTVVVCGRQDYLTPLETHVEMAGLIPGARLVVIEDCGHLAPLEQPQAVTAVLRYWLQAD